MNSTGSKITAPWPKTWLKGFVIVVVLLSGLLGNHSAMGQADFTADVNKGCAPLLVKFTDRSTGTPTSWLWDFGNGITSTDPSPLAQIPFGTPGTYTVTLTVTYGASTSVKTMPITVFDPPKTTITILDSIGCFPFPVNFQTTIDPGTAQVSSLSWDFGDGTPFNNTQSPLHTYLVDGTFTPTLTVAMDNGCRTSFITPRKIRVSTGVTTDFFFPVLPSCTPPISISFQNTSTGPGTLSYQWDFGNGSTSTKKDDVANYTAGGNYLVTLTTASSNGCKASVSKNITIPTSSSHSDFQSPDTSCVGAKVNFTNLTVPGPDSSFWDLGNGTKLTSLNVVNATYASSGTYLVKLVNRIGVCLDSVTKPIVITAPPVIQFSNSSTVSCKAPFQVSFSDQTQNAVSWSWLFNNGLSSNLSIGGKDVVVNFPDTGNYTAFLSVKDSRGCMANAIYPDLIQIHRPRIYIRNLQDSGCLPFTFKPDLAIQAIDGVQSTLWAWGDGASDPQTNATHTYSLPGTYNYTLRVVTNTGCDTTITNGSVKAGNPPATPDFTANIQDACAGTPIQFTDLTSGGVTIDSWNWDFGDKNHSGFKNPLYTYADTGTFTVSLTVNNFGCGATTIKKDFVKIHGAVARFGFTVNCNDRLSVLFSDSSLLATSWSWDFGDGSPVYVGQKPPAHRFPDFKDYFVKLTVSDGTCSFTSVRRVRVLNEIAHFSLRPNPLCKGGASGMEAYGSLDSNLLKYEWDFGNGTFTAGARAVSYLYPNSGKYNTRLKITDVNGCQDSTALTLGVGGPLAGVGVVIPTGCKGLTAEFLDTSRSDGVNAISARYWDFGDGSGRQQINTGPVSHVYSGVGDFDVKLVIQDAGGCSDSVTIRGLVSTSAPKAAFHLSDSSSCPGSPIQFINDVPATIGNLQWDFGDGSVSSPADPRDPIHRYAGKGLYSVKLKVRDKLGCEDSIAVKDLILIDVPRAAFDISDTIGSCPPLKVSFTFKGSFYKSFKWIFGDSANSVEMNPQHNFNRAGNYTALLVLTSPGGCQDTAKQVIHVKGPNGFLDFTPRSGCPGTPVDFTLASPTDVDSVLWNFGDSTALGTTFSISHRYDSARVDANGNFQDYPVNVTLFDKFKCRVTVYGVDSFMHIVGLKADFNTDRTKFCSNGTVQFTDTSLTNDPIAARLWDFGDGSTSADINPLHFYAKPGLYPVTLTISSPLGCSNQKTKTDLIAVVAKPDIAIGSSADSICIYGSATLRGIVVTPDTSALQWNWDLANGQTSTFQEPASQTYGMAGDLTITLKTTNSTGCVDTSKFALHVQPLPTTDAGLDTTLCLGQSVQLNATGANSYQWQAPATALSCTDCGDPVANPANSMVYRVTGYTAFGCTLTDSVRVNIIQPSTVVAPPNDSVCYAMGIRLNATGTEVYSWSPSTGLSDTNIPNPLARPASSITYTVTGSDRRGCFVTTDTVHVTVFPIPQLDIGRDTTISVGASLPIHAQVSADVLSIQWKPARSLSCVDCLDPVVKPSTSTTYQATVTNDGGCTTMDEISVSVICNKANIFMPNTFSPNGDGMNDTYYPRGHGVQAIRSLRIFNRWGQLIFEKRNFNANDASMAWDGTFHGSVLAPDVYVYIMEYVCENGVVVAQNGDITLVR